MEKTCSHVESDSAVFTKYILLHMFLKRLIIRSLFRIGSRLASHIQISSTNHLIRDYYNKIRCLMQLILFNISL